MLSKFHLHYFITVLEITEEMDLAPFPNLVPRAFSLFWVRTALKIGKKALEARLPIPRSTVMILAKTVLILFLLRAYFDDSNICL